MTKTSINKKNMFGYFMFCMGFPIFNNFVDSFMDLYLTQIGISTAIIGIIVGVAQIFDGINDPIFGILVDKRPFRRGKYKGWMIIASIFMPLLTISIFMIPSGISIKAKIIWAFVTYLLYTTFYDTGDVSIFGVPMVMTSKVHERNVLTGRRVFAGTIAVLIITVAAPFLYSNVGWLPAAIIFATAGFLLMFPFSLYFKEKAFAEETKQITLRELITSASRNKYLLLYNIAILILKLTNAVLILSPFVAKYCLKNDIYSTVLYLLLMVPVIPFSLLIGKISEKIDKFNILRICIIGCILTSVLCWIVGYSNIVLLIIFGFLRGIFFGPMTTLMYGFTSDIVEYGQFHTNKRAEGIALSFQTLCSKVGSGIQNTIAMSLLAVFGFISGNTTQTATAQSGIWILFTLIPCVGYLLSLILLHQYKLRDKYVQIMQSSNMGEISHKDAEEKLNLLGFEK